MLLEWVANASPGDQIPEPWRWSHKPTWSVIISLVSLGIIKTPQPGTEMAVLAGEASAAARAWLEAHPADA